MSPPDLPPSRPKKKVVKKVVNLSMFQGRTPPKKRFIMTRAAAAAAEAEARAAPPPNYMVPITRQGGKTYNPDTGTLTPNSKDEQRGPRAPDNSFFGSLGLSKAM